MNFFHTLMPYQSDLEIYATVAAVVVGGLLYLLQFTLLYIFRYKRDPNYDPRPFRLWFIVACANLFFAGIWSPEYEMVPSNTACVLFAFLIYLYNDMPDFYSTDSSLNRWA